MSEHSAQIDVTLNERLERSAAATSASMAVDCAPEPMQFRTFELYRRARLLLRQGHPVEIGARAFDLLCLLLAFRGQVVERDEIMKFVWPTTTVDESNLRFQIANLRRCIGSARELIKTIPGRGYMLTQEAPFGPLRLVSGRSLVVPEEPAKLGPVDDRDGETPRARLDRLEAENLALRRLLIVAAAR